jgi:hypothetical protein
MELFRSNKREKPDIEFITKAKLKQIKFDGEVKKRGRSREELIMMIPPNTSTQHMYWVLQIPFDTGHEAHFVSANRPQMTSNVQNGRYDSTSNGFREHTFMSRQEWSDLYIEFRDIDTGTRLVEWIRDYSSIVTGRNGYGGNAKKNLTLEMIDPAGTIVEQWHMVGCFPTEVRYHQEMFDTNPIIGVNFSIDRAVLNV